jgi:hypothetical protein
VLDHLEGDRGVKGNHLIMLAVVGVLFVGSWSRIPVSTSTRLIVTVNRIGDGSDRNPGDGLCDVSVNAGEQCSLRAAIEEINAWGPGISPHRIEFDISGTGPFILTPGSELPSITVPVEIDGATQPGATCPTDDLPANLVIVLDGSNAGTAADGLTLYFGSDGSTIRGLVIVNFAVGIFIRSYYNTVQCSHLGLGADGVSERGNDIGAFILGLANSIGGLSTPDQRNVISGNADEGITVRGHANSIAGNFVGTTADGMSPLGNGAGINIQGIANAIEHNLISGNGEGIVFRWGGFSNDTTIQGNDIGIAQDGITPLPNTGHGILFEPWTVATVVGGDAADANRIAFNGGDGIRIQGFCCLLNNQIRKNAIYANGGLGIDLGGDGPDTNDSGDGDTGENERQNYPVLTHTPGRWIIDGSLDSQPNIDYTVDVYRNESCDPSGYGEGEHYLNTVQVTSDGSGQAAFSIDLTGIVSAGDGITATATDPGSNTSEFSNCVTLVDAENGSSLYLPLIGR